MFKPNQRQKVLYAKNIDGIIQANLSVDQLLALLLNNFSDQFNEMSPRLIEQLEESKKHMQNLNTIFRGMQK